MKMKRTPEFALWLDSIKDRPSRVRLTRRLERAASGHLRDVKPVGGNVWEMREFFGPGQRMYYTVRQEVLIVMLGGGNKSTQSADIARAIEWAAALEDEDEHEE